MQATRKKRLFFVLFIVIGVSLAVTCILFALSQNINLFYTPSQVMTGEVPQGQVFRIGGLVKVGSVQRYPDSLKVSFVLTDTQHDVTVLYNGILPDLFREGQGIVALGSLAPGQQFMASEVLAKHDENYMPPEVKHALDTAQATS